VLCSYGPRIHIFGFASLYFAEIELTAENLSLRCSAYDYGSIADIQKFIELFLNLLQEVPNPSSHVSTPKLGIVRL
jgi:hypothetical protein